MLRILIAILLLSPVAFGQWDQLTRWTPTGHNTWHNTDIPVLQKFTTDPVPRNYQDSTGWHEIETDFHENGEGFYVSWNSLLKTTINPNGGEVLVTMTWDGVDYTVVQQLHSLKFFRKSDSAWIDIDDSPDWSNVSFDSNIVTWTGIFPGVDYRVQKDTARVNTGIFFKPGFLDSSVILYNQRSDSADIYLASVTAYTLSANIDDHDSSLGNVMQRKLKQLGSHVFQLGRQRLRFPGYLTVAEVPVWQRHKIVGNTLYVLEFVKMSAIKLIHATLPTATIWHNAALEAVQPTEGEDDASIRWGTTDETSKAITLMWVGRSGGGVGLGSITIFRNITIEKDAIIDAAWIDYKANNATSATVVNGIFQVEDNNAPDTIHDDGSTGYDNWVARTFSATTVAWNAIPAWAAATWYKSPELKTIVQVPINHASWSSGDDIAIVLGDEAEASDTPSRFREIRQYEQSAAEAAKLTIYYHVGNVEISTFASSDQGTNWTDPGNATGLPDFSCAVYDNSGQNILTLHNGGFSSVTGTVDSINFVVYGYGTQSQAPRRDFEFQLTKTGGGLNIGVGDLVGDIRVINSSCQTRGISNVVGNTDWSASMAASDITASTFGINIADDDATAHELGIDGIIAAVHYTPAGVAAGARRRRLIGGDN